MMCTSCEPKPTCFAPNAGDGPNKRAVSSSESPLTILVVEPAPLAPCWKPDAGLIERRVGFHGPSRKSSRAKGQPTRDDLNRGLSASETGTHPTSVRFQANT